MGSTSATRASAPSKPPRRGLGDLPPPENPRYVPGARDADAGDHAGPSAAAAPPPSSSSLSVAAPLVLDGAAEDAALRGAGVLSREEVLQRRLRRVRQLARYYRRQYWGLMEAVRVRHRDYYWNFGRSPTKVDERGGEGEGEGVGDGGLGVAAVEGSGESGRVGGGVGGGEAGGSKKKDKDRCGFPGCKTKPMALTAYCHLHILSDPKQKLYKACMFPIKSVHTGPITCGKPVFRAEPLSYCPTHVQKVQKNVSQALKKAGLPQNYSRPSPKINIIIAECVRQIQAKRREAQEATEKETDEGVADEGFIRIVLRAFLKMETGSCMTIFCTLIKVLERGTRVERQSRWSSIQNSMRSRDKRSLHKWPEWMNQ
ncbi:hypothetical protein Taro_026851 [Colocasia esculenta]|uniref:KAT8 regulatory NSL complex subunit 2 n=1 Tax=Colocasia esculenta TaxID=4460 RepID=A0A843VPV7_COLES|nr:hypothetical protein [Colocasia esculenta]